MVLTFSDCSLDTARRVLTRGGDTVAVEPQVFDLLVVLAANAGRVVSKDDLIDAVWGGRIVSDAAISARINAARSAVGDNGKDQRVIRTVQRRGFELVAPVKAEAEAAPEDPDAPDLRQTIRYTTSRDGTGIAYAVSGDGPPLLRAGHHLTHLELDWASPLWRPHFQLLGRHHRLVRYDVRGTGLSDVRLEGATLDHYVDDMLAVADAAGLERFPIIGTLQCAPVAIRFAARHPDRVSKLIVQNGYARGRGLRDDASADPDADPLISLVKSGNWGDPDNAFMRAFCALASASLNAEQVTHLIRLFDAATTGAAVVAARRLINRFDVRDDLGDVRAPTLVLHARNCAIHPVEEGRMIAAGIKGAEFVVFESGDAPCFPPDPSWNAQNAAILDFLSRE